MKLDEEEKSSFDSIPSETNDEFIAIICRIVDDEQLNTLPSVFLRN